MKKLIHFMVLLLAMMTLQASSNSELPEQFSVHKVTDNVFVFTQHWNEQSSANFGAVVGEQGILLINSMMRADAAAVEKALASISDKQVKYVINSNWDTYNTQSNQYFAEKGATIISHENLKYRPAYTQQTFKEQFSMNFAGEVVTAYRSGGHSLGHVNVHLAKANVIFMADSFRNDWMTIAGPNGIAGHLVAIKAAMQRGNGETIFVPGNTQKAKPFSHVEDLLKEIDVRKAFKALLISLHQQGLTAVQIAEHAQMKALFKDSFPGRDFSPKSNVFKAIQSEITPDFRLTLQQKQQLIGNYRAGTGEIIEVILSEGRLLARGENNFITVLKPKSATRMEIFPSGKSTGFNFERQANGKVTAFITDIQQSYFRHFIKQGRWTKVSD